MELITHYILTNVENFESDELYLKEILENMVKHTESLREWYVMTVRCYVLAKGLLQNQKEIISWDNCCDCCDCCDHNDSCEYT